MKPTFRLANKADISEIIKLTNECFGENTDLSYAQKIWEQFEKDPNQIYINGYLENQLVAHVKLTIIPTIYSPMESYAMINHLCVKPEARRHHIGTQLLDFCKKVAKERGCVEISLWSKNFRQPAHAMYQKYGFEVVDAKFFTYDLRGVDYEN